MLSARRHDLLPARCRTSLLATRIVCRDRDDDSLMWPAEHSEVAIEVGGLRGRAMHDSRVVHLVRPDLPGSTPRDRLDVVWAVEAGAEPGVRDRGLRCPDRDGPEVRRMCLPRIEPGAPVLAHLSVHGALPVPLAHGVRSSERWPVDLQVVIETGEWPSVAVGPHPVEVQSAEAGRVVLRVQPDAAFEIDVDFMVDLHGGEQDASLARVADELAVLRAGLVVERQWLERARQARLPGVGAGELRRGLSGVEAGERFMAVAERLLEAMCSHRDGGQLAWRARLSPAHAPRDEAERSAQVVAACAAELIEQLGALGPTRLPRRLASMACVAGAEVAARVGITVEPWRGCRLDALAPMLRSLAR